MGKILIVGAGIGGLSAAISLQKKGHETVVFERVTDLRPVGAAISVWSNGIKVLNSFGLSKEVSEVGGVMDSMSYCSHDTGKPLCEFSLEPLYREVKQRAFPISRAHLQHLLYEKAGPSNIHLGKKAVKYTTSDTGVTLEFQDGETATGDFLVISDGTHSVFRQQICGKSISRNYVGYVNFNGSIPVSEFEGLLDPARWTQYVGEGKRVSFMPMGDDRFYFFFDANLPQQASRAAPETIQPELKKHFEGWNKVVQLAIDKLDPTKVARAEICDTDPLPSFIDPTGRAVLIGDAAHATAPDLGQGGCQAMEDAFVIGELLEKEGVTGNAPVEAEALKKVVQQYQDARMDRVQGLVVRARQRAEITHALKGMDQTKQWYEELVVEDGSRIMSGMIKTIAAAPAALEGQAEIQPASKAKAATS